MYAKYLLGCLFAVAIDESHLWSRLDNHSYTDTSQSLLSQNGGYELMCGKRSTPATCTEPCTCTNVYNIPLNDVVDVMIYDQSIIFTINTYEHKYI